MRDMILDQPIRRNVLRSLAALAAQAKEATAQTPSPVKGAARKVPGVAAAPGRMAMRTPKQLVGPTAVSVGLVLATLLSSAARADEARLSISGYDPVAYFS